MGHAVLRALSAAPNDAFTVVGGVDLCAEDAPIPVFASTDAIDVEADVAIDFSVPAATMQILDYCCKMSLPLVICTTGLTEAHIARIEDASKQIPIFRSGNMSLGVNLMRTLCKIAEQTLGTSFDVELIEMHHNRKIDAPSGTALMLADSIASCMQEQPTYVYGRHDDDRRRAPNEIGIHSVRGGTIVGEHEAWFMGEDEAIVIRHQAFSKRVFATGALRAASFLAGKAAGLYSMDELVTSLIH